MQLQLSAYYDEKKSFRLAVAKYSLVHGIPYKVETSKPEVYKTSSFRGIGFQGHAKPGFGTQCLVGRFLVCCAWPWRTSFRSIQAMVPDETRHHS
jgi:hypothetical protein